MMATLHISNNLSYMRKQLQWTQEGLAEQLGVSYQAVSKWENRLAFPDITLLPEIARLFQITIDELLLIDLSEQRKQVTASETLPAMQNLVLKHEHQPDNQETAAHGEPTYSIKLFYNGSECAEFPEWAKEIEISLTGGVNDVNSDFSINCDTIHGNATAGLNVSCNNIGGNAYAGGNLSCDEINGSSVSAGSNIYGDTIYGNATAGSSIQCNIIHGTATAGHQINCEQILHES